MRVRRVSETVVNGLGGRIRDARTESPKSLSELCTEVGFSSTYWYDIENERIKGALSMENLRAIENALGISFGINLGPNN